jgi:hypothetical protein
MDSVQTIFFPLAEVRNGDVYFFCVAVQKKKRHTKLTNKVEVVVVMTHD